MDYRDFLPYLRRGDGNGNGSRPAIVKLVSQKHGKEQKAVSGHSRRKHCQLFIRILYLVNQTFSPRLLVFP